MQNDGRTRRKRRRLLAAISLAWTAQAAASPMHTGYTHTLVGDPADVRRPAARASRTVLMGGGPVVEEAFRWMIERSRGGNFVVIRAAGTDAYNAYIHALGGVASVETLVIPSREAADDDFVAQRVRGAEALLIAGGDQSDYVNYWRGTRLEHEIHALAAKGVPIAGTSAGLAILGKYAFSAQRGTIRSAAALANPYDDAITFSRDFLALPDLDNVITDSHFDSRNRMGRLIVFMSRLISESPAQPVRGIGVDVGTALVVENGRAQVAGDGAVHFVEMTSPPEVAVPGRPLTHRGVHVERLISPGRYDLRRWTGLDDSSVRYQVAVIDGELRSGLAQDRSNEPAGRTGG